MRAQLKLAAGLVGLTVVLSGCGGGGGGGSNSPATSSTNSGGTTSAGPTSMAPAATSLNNIGIGLKQLQLSWPTVAGATYYTVWESANGSDFVQVSGNLAGTETTFNRDIAVHQQNWAAARYQVQSCNTAGCSTSAAVGATSGVLKAIGYFKASNTNDADTFGWVLALSADGNTLAVGAPGEASNAGGAESDNTAADAGAVYVFAHASGGWTQQAYLKAPTPHAGDTFGESLAISGNGDTLVVGAPLENLNSLNDSGAAYVFSRNPSTEVWTKSASLQPTTLAANTYFGWATAINDAGTKVAISAVGLSNNAGGVYVFTRSTTSTASWTPPAAVLTASNAETGDNFGTSLAMNSLGNVLAVGAPYEASSATGIDGDRTNNSSTDAGAVYVFKNNGSSWAQAAYIKASNTAAGKNFGASVALNSSGTLLAVGAPYDSATAALAGAVYLFSDSGTWSQTAYLKALNVGANDNFGTAVALAGSGDTLVVGAIGESSAATGVAGSQTDNSKDGVGAAYIFKLTGSTWTQQTYLKPATAQAAGEFGSTIGLSADTKTLAIGASFEGSNSTGISAGDTAKQSNMQAPESGAVWLY